MWLDSKSVQKAFALSPRLKVASFAVVGLLLLASIFGVWKAFSMPAQWEQPIALVSYDGQGKFDYSVDVLPSHLFGPPLLEAPEEEETTSIYFTNIIDSIDVEFTYTFIPQNPAVGVTSEASIVAIVTGPSGWQKEFLLDSVITQAKTLVISFPLELEKFDEEINTVEEELGIRAGFAMIYDLVIEARVQVWVNAGSVRIRDTFVQPMEIRVSSGTLEWDNKLVRSKKTFYEGINYEQKGEFDYTIKLKENSLYGPEITTLSPHSDGSTPVVSQPAGEIYFPRLVENMNASFSWRFISDKPVRNLVEEVEITAILESPDIWRKTFILVPKTKKTGDFTINFPVDINYLNEFTNTIRGEIGRAVPVYNLSLEAVVNVTGDTDFGRINKVFTQTLEGQLTETLLTWSTELTKSEPGNITGVRLVQDPNVRTFQILSPIGLALTMFVLMFVMRNASQATPVMSKIEEEALRAKKKYKKIIVDIKELPVAGSGETVITCSSVDEVVKIADALLKPVLHLASTDRHIYCVIDVVTRYQYVSELKPFGEGNLDLE